MKYFKAMNNQEPIKILVLGDKNVGKSAISVRFMTKRFIGEYNSNHDYTYSRNVSLGQLCKRHIEIMDVSGRKWLQKSTCEVQSVIQWSNCIVLCYSITDRHSFHFLHKIASLITEHRSSYGPILVLGNKLDLERGRQVDKMEGKALAVKIGAQFQEISAIEPLNSISSSFENMIQQVLHLRSNCAKLRPNINPHSKLKSPTANEKNSLKTNDCEQSGRSSSRSPTNNRFRSTAKTMDGSIFKKGRPQISVNENLSPICRSSSFSVPCYVSPRPGPPRVLSSNTMGPSVNTSCNPRLSPTHFVISAKKLSLASNFNLFGSLFSTNGHGTTRARKESFTSSKNM